MQLTEMVSTVLIGILGLVVLMGIAILFSNNRKAIDWRLTGIGISLQLIFALIVIVTPWGSSIFDFIGDIFVTIINFTFKGTIFIFGDQLGDKDNGFIFAFHALSTIIFFSSLMSMLYHMGVMQKVVQGMAWVMTRTMKISGGEALSVAANVFIGQTEAPLVVRPYINKMTQSELLTLMVGGMATIAGSVLGAYVFILGGDLTEQAYFAKHLLSASVMAAPATIVIAKLLYPETEESLTKGSVKINIEKTASNVIEAAANGASDGLRLAVNVGAMLLAFIALIYMFDTPLNWIGDKTGLNELIGQTFSLSYILGFILQPIAWLIGVPWEDALTVGSLIGEKVVLNEFVAYQHLGEIKATLTPKAALVSTYALCGFANFSSIAIQIGGIGPLAPDRKSDIARFGLRAVLGGSIATMMTATIAGVLTSFM